MDTRLAQPALQEARDSGESDEITVGIQCAGCTYELWSHVRQGVPIDIQCFRDGCNSVTTITVSLN